jgi:type III pantothenate kinase
MMNDIRALLFDIGNTRLKWGYWSDARISKSGDLTHEQIHDKGFAALTTHLPRNVTHALACNVAGTAIATKLSGVIGMHGDLDLRFARCDRTSCGVTTSYKQPRRLGVDRWVAMIGAWNEFKSALCIVDAGTAMTIDVIDRSGQHLGGQIIPGIHLMGESLRSKTSDIAAATKKSRDPGDGLGIFGKNTDDAIAYGTLTAACGAIERAAKRVRSAGMRPKIVLTGGDASRILKQLNSNAIHRPHLVLQGLATMLQSEK